jgi:acetyl esterase/lipase
MKRRFLSLAGSLLALVSVARAAEPAEILLWPGDAPGSEGKTGVEHVRVTERGDHVVSGVHRPSITPYLANPGKNSGASVLIMPGGGHSALWMDHEGYNVARALAGHGISAFVLKYRLARETNSTYQIEGHALKDVQRAIRYIRSRAGGWNLDPDRLGVMGFSAGGELASLASLRFDSGDNSLPDLIEHPGSKPAFQALIYPGRSASIIPTRDSPPAFLACAYDDRPDIGEGMAEVYLRFKKVGVRAELHIYSSGGHGFGYRNEQLHPASQWLARFEEWLGDSGFLARK